jgi:predicted nucleic acid-binding Zn ribbon protein
MDTPAPPPDVADPQALLQAMREQLTQHDESRKRPSRLSTPIR